MTYHRINQGDAIHICFLGCGSITKDHAKRAMKADSNVKVSFASRTLSKAEEYRNKHKGSKAFGSYQEAIEDPDINVIMINTPPFAHFDLSKKALEAGKHVIVEKPPFFKSEDFDTIGQISDQRHLQFMIAENYYYKPLRKVIEKIFDESLIGDPLFAIINATKTQDTKGDWRDDRSLSGFGALFEGGIHWINFINNIGLDISSVTGFKPKSKTALERSMQVTANTSQGVILNLLYSWEVNTIAKGLRISRIYGREGSVIFETNGLFVWVRGRKKKLIFPGLKHISGYQKMFDDFFSALRGGEAPQLSWQQAKKDLVLIEQAYASAT